MKQSLKKINEHHKRRAQQNSALTRVKEAVMSYKRIYVLTLSVAFCLLLAVSSAVAAPAITSVSGTTALNNGDVVTVTGSSFGTTRTADYWDTFDDYSADWSVNGSNQAAFPSIGSKWSGDGGWTKTYFDGDGAYATQINGKPLLHLDAGGAQYSTGRGFTQTAEYYNNSDGAHPNSGIGLPTTASTSTEIYGVYHRKYDANWNYLLDPGSVWEKEMEIWMDDNTKMYIVNRYVDQYGATFSPQSMRSYISFETGGSWSTVDSPNANGAIPFGGKWYEVKFYLKLNTPGATDGIVKIWINGQLTINDTTVNLRGSNSNLFGGGTLGRGLVYFFGNLQWGGTAKFTPIGVGNEWDRMVDDVWVWRSNQSQLDSQFPLIPVVYLSNQSTWGTGPTDKLNGDSNFVRQKVGGTDSANLGFKSWSDTGFKFVVDRGSVDTSKAVYMYVTNWSGQTNSAGYLVSGQSITRPAKLPEFKLTN